MNPRGYFPTPVMIGLIFFLVACGPSKPKVPTDKAVPYELISIEDTSFRGRTRFNAVAIAPLAKTAEQRAQTALKAAMHLQEQRSADEASVFLEISPPLSRRGFALAIADYAPDGGGLSGDTPFVHGVWQAQTTNYEVPADVLKIAELWYKNEGKFQVKDRFGGTKTDEKVLKKYIADLIHTRPSKVSVLPLMTIITTRHAYAGK